MAIEILAAGGTSTQTESFTYQVDYDSVSQTIGVSATGQGHGALTIVIPSASFTYGPVSLDPYVNQGRVPLPAGSPATVPASAIPPVPGRHQSWPWTVTLTWQS